MSPMEAVQAHRRQQAAAGWPLLNSCPSTFVVKQVMYLEALSPGDLDALFADWEACERDAEEAGRSPHEQLERLDAFPAFASYMKEFQSSWDRRSASTLSVKLVAGVLKDPAIETLDDWARLLNLPKEATRLRPPLASRMEDLVPVAPRTMRSGLKKMMKTRFQGDSVRMGSDHTHFEGLCDGCKVVLDVLFAAGWSKHSLQISPHLSVIAPDGAHTINGGYEGLWSIPVQWDYITEENWERSLAHLGDVIEVLGGLVQGDPAGDGSD